MTAKTYESLIDPPPLSQFTHNLQGVSGPLKAKGSFQEGGSVSRVNIGRLITTIVTSRHTAMFFKMAGNFLVLYFCKR